MPSGPPNYSGQDWDDLDESYPQDDELAEYGAACVREIRRVAETTHRVTHNADGTQKDASIATAAIQDSAVTTAKIANGAVTLEKLPFGTAFLAEPNGYVKLPSGIIFQWCVGVPMSDEGAHAVVSFPIAFPTACLNVQITGKIGQTGTGPDNWFQIISFSTTGCDVQMQYGGGLPGAITPYLFAIGY